MRRFILVLIIFFLPVSVKADELLTRAVEKLILDVHHLKLQVLELQQEVEELKEKRHRTASNLHPNCSFTVVRGEVKESPTSCILAAVRRIRKEGTEYLLSRLPLQAPLYIKRYKNYCVYLTLPRYCKQVKERIKDASVVHISIPAPADSDSSVSRSGE